MVALIVPAVPKASVPEACKPPERKRFFQRAATVPKSSVASVSETSQVLMATVPRLDKVVLAPATIQVPVESKKQPFKICKPLAKVEVTELLVTFKTVTDNPPAMVLVEPLPKIVEVEEPPTAR